MKLCDLGSGFSQLFIVAFADNLTNPIRRAEIAIRWRSWSVATRITHFIPLSQWSTERDRAIREEAAEARVFFVGAAELSGTLLEYVLAFALHFKSVDLTDSLNRSLVLVRI